VQGLGGQIRPMGFGADDTPSDFRELCYFFRQKSAISGRKCCLPRSTLRRHALSRATLLRLLTLHHHEVILAEFALTECEQHLDEQTIRRRLIGDDDRL
jgi:hypothetical protein